MRLRMTVMRKVRALGGSLCVTAALLATALAGSAQDKSEKTAGDPKHALPNAGNDAALNAAQPPTERPLRFQDFGTGIRISAAMQTFAVANPISVAAIRVMA